MDILTITPGNVKIKAGVLGEFPIGLLEEQSVLFQIRRTLANDYSLCPPFLQGFKSLQMSRVGIREH